MAEIKSKKNNLPLVLIIVLAVVIVAGALVVYFNWLAVDNFQIQNNGAVNPAAVLTLNSEQIAVLDALKNLSRCGQWPLADLTLSAGRGNPFLPGSPGIANATSSATSTPVVPLCVKLGENN